MALQFIEVLCSVSNKVHQLSYECFGKTLGTAPVILINHALTGNSNVAGNKGWWNDLVAYEKVIDLNIYTVIAFNIPGNGYDGNVNNLINNYQEYSTKQVAQLFWSGIFKLHIQHLYAVIGGSLGGAIAWEMAFLYPDKISKLIPIATNYKASDWLIGNVFIQNSILKNSSKPIQDARYHAMFLYRSPKGINAKFNREFNIGSNTYTVENWLKYHGDALQNRFTLPAYKLMNHLLKTIGATFFETDLINWAVTYRGEVHCIAVNSDLMFTQQEQLNTFNIINNYCKARFSVISSIHGHDAFLIEFNQLQQFLKSDF